MRIDVGEGCKVNACESHVFSNPKESTNEGERLEVDARKFDVTADEEVPVCTRQCGVDQSGGCRSPDKAMIANDPADEGVHEHGPA